MEQEHYLIGKRNLKKDNHWEELNREYFRITKPTVICLGGNGTIEARNANFMCRIAQSLVGVTEPTAANEIATTQDIDFVGISYVIDDKKNETGSISETDYSQLLRSIFQPLYLNEKGRPYPREQILKNFNLITFFSHCYGATVVSTLIEKTRENMRGFGIDAQTIDDALGQVFAVNYAPWQSVPCPNLQVISEKDITLPSGPVRSKITCEFLEDRFFHRCNGEGTVAFKENDNTISLIASRLTRKEQDEHSISFIERDGNWRIWEDDVLYGDDVSKAMGVALVYSIASGIQNQRSASFTPKLGVDEVLHKVQSILGATQNVDFADAIEQIIKRFEAKQNKKQREPVLEY